MLLRCFINPLWKLLNVNYVMIIYNKFFLPLIRTTIVIAFQLIYSNHKPIGNQLIQ